MLMCYIRISIRLGFCAYRTRASLVAQLVKNPPAMQEIWFQFLGWEDPWRRRRLPTPVFWPGELRGLYSPRGGKELDTTEQLSLSFSLFTCRTEALTEAVTSPDTAIILRNQLKANLPFYLSFQL